MRELLRACEELTRELLNVLIAYVGVALSVPVLILATLWYLVEDGGPPLFLSKRVGLKGKIFRMAKVRTMRVRAWSSPEGAYTLRNDPRETSLGRYLRRLSLDELPQFLNVLRGEMRVVGPRPAIPERHFTFPEPLRSLRVSVKPGITGLAQLSGRNLLSWEERLKLDVEYVKRQSILLDLWLILRTPIYALRGEGLYYDRAGDEYESERASRG